MTRSQLAAYLQSQFSRLAQDVEQAASDDSATGYGPDIDQAFRWLGVANESLASYAVPQVDEYGATALAEMFALRRFASLLTTRSDMLGYGADPNRDNAFRNVATLLKVATLRVENAGYGAPRAQANAELWTLGRLTLDYIETPVEDW